MLTLGVHLVKSAFGQWLPGDERGHWSPAWDKQIGFSPSHRLNAGDPVRLAMAQRAMTRRSVTWTPVMIQIFARTLRSCAEDSDWSPAALSIEPTHLHALIRGLDRDADITIKWVSDRMTKAVRRETGYAGPVFAKGRWRCFVFDEEQWINTLNYITRHEGKREV
ncbi:MAG: hypothetical protein AAF328_05265 [Planctomycetota bacterium]